MVKKRVLIIEDEHNIAQAERLILDDHFETFVAGDGEDGLKKAIELKPDLIILDLMLPSRNGYDICYHLRQSKPLKKTKILMVTAKNQKIDEDKGMMVGADDYLTKPFEPVELLHLAQQLTNS